ncbi:speckle-type POZ protein B-like [Nasonia vitripennis]|uniref:BTB domain-containing protein n=1 Tax=Nasonia vitripennis TaxID=7425 RepID=A0A7M7Q9G7_NASVI|nr:speckle-type POZ protein B-like [Nasonia vitripennis]
MFQSQMKETQENKVFIEDIEHDVFVEMLRFIYSGKVRHLDRIAKKLLATADRYLLENLKKLCEIELCKQLCVENAPEILELADKLRAETLKNSAIKYIVGNKKIIVDRPEFRALTHKLIYEVCKAMV